MRGRAVQGQGMRAREIHGVCRKRISVNAQIGSYIAVGKPSVFSDITICSICHSGYHSVKFLGPDLI